MGWLNTKYPASCRSCGKRMPVGTRVYYHRSGRGQSVTCETCKTAPRATTDNADMYKTEAKAPLPVESVWVDAYQDVSRFRAKCLEPRHPQSRDDFLHPDSRASSRFSPDFWAGARNSREAWTILQGGWTDGASKVNDMLAAFPVPRVPGKRRVRVWSEEGETLDRDRWRDGREDCWSSSRLVRADNGRRANLRIVVQGNVSWRRTSDEYLWSGLLATSLADLIETCGIRCQLDVCFPCEKWWTTGPFLAGPLITVKQYDEPLDRARVIAWTGHPAAHRCAVFRWASVVGPEYGNYGLNTDAVETYKEALALGDGDIYVRRIFDQHAALDFLHAELTRLGIEWD